jgi:hypothetical protein
MFFGKIRRKARRKDSVRIPYGHQRWEDFLLQERFFLCILQRAEVQQCEEFGGCEM